MVPHPRPAPTWSHVLAFIALPGLGIAGIPAALLLLTRVFDAGFGLDFPKNLVVYIPGMLAAGLGLFLAIATVSLFTRVGRGTLAPWDPPRHLVVRGIYRHVRNPMITGACLVLLAEGLLFGSWPLLVWFAVFLLGNAIYIPLIEERRLQRRFGAEYDMYVSNVPRWIPRFRPWSPPGPTP